MNKVTDIRERLRDQELLKSADESVIDHVLSVAQIEVVKGGEYVCLQGKVESPLIMVLSGQLRKSGLSADGHEIPIGTFSAGQSVGEVAIIADRPIAGNIIASRNSTIARIGRKQAQPLLLDPQIAPALNRSLALRMTGLINRHIGRELPSAAARVAAIVVEEFDRIDDDDPQPIDPLSQFTIAAMANVSRETVSRVLASLETRGVICKEGRRIRVLDRSVLRNLAGR